VENKELSSLVLPFIERKLYFDYGLKDYKLVRTPMGYNSLSGKFNYLIEIKLKKGLAEFSPSTLILNSEHKPPEQIVQGIGVEVKSNSFTIKEKYNVDLKEAKYSFTSYTIWTPRPYRVDYICNEVSKKCAIKVSGTPLITDILGGNKYLFF
jgi:hypothetical protein